MKNLKLIGVGVLSLLAFSACNDDSQDILENSPAVNGLKVINYGSGTTGKSSGMTIATFSSQAVYDNYTEDLEAQVEAWDANFENTWGHLDDEALNAKEEELNFDDEKPLTDFENQIGLQSLRKQYLADEALWLDNDILSEITDPDAKSVYDFDQHEMAVINTLGEVQVGTKIIKQLNEEEIEAINSGIKSGRVNKKNIRLVERGATLVIEDGDYDTLIAFNDGDISVIDDGNVNVNTGNSSVGCESGKEKRRYIDTAPGKRIKAVIKVVDAKLYSPGKVKTKIKSFKKRRRRGWKKWRTNIAAGARGNVFNVACGQDFFYLDNQMTSTKRRRKRVFKWKNRDYTSHKVENGGVTGLYKQNNVLKELKLTW